jgi:predicted transporter
MKKIISLLITIVISLILIIGAVYAYQNINGEKSNVISHSLTVSASDYGSCVFRNGSVASGIYTVSQGENITLTAIAQSSHQFAYWIVNGKIWTNGNQESHSLMS